MKQRLLESRDFAEFLVRQTPKFDELIMQDIRPADGWLLNLGDRKKEYEWPPSWMPAEVWDSIQGFNGEGTVGAINNRFSDVWPNITMPMGTPVATTNDKFMPKKRKKKKMGY